MKKVILLIEDTPSEQTIARELLISNGYKVIVADNLKDARRHMDNLKGLLNGIITDLHFPEGEVRGDAGKNPCGLVVVTWALLNDIPVSICSDVDHHYANYLKFLLSDLQRLTGKSVPFTMDSKNWEKALVSLRNIM